MANPKLKGVETEQMSKIMDNLVDGTAVAYLLAYTCLMEKDKEVRDFYSGQASIYVFPAVINAAFSCEVALKNLINAHEDRFVRGHDLKVLFEKMSPQLQKKYADQTIAFYNEIALCGNGKMASTEFLRCLDEAKDTYEHKRYLYEKPFGVDIDFLESLMFSLNDAREEYVAFKKRTMS